LVAALSAAAPSTAPSAVSVALNSSLHPYYELINSVPKRCHQTYHINQKFALYFVNFVTSAILQK